MNVLIGGAWPYANGSLHIGHIAALLPGDVLARYHRAKGDTVYFVSGSDCHGTPVTIRAKQENKTPLEISEKYHKEFSECFLRLGISYDLYGKTSSEEHKNFVFEFHKSLYESEYVYEKTVPQAYCENCKQFLADRFVTGECPNCASIARGDQCDACGKVLEPENLIEPKCCICNAAPVFKETNHLYLAITKLENRLREFIDGHPEWRKNAIQFSKRYISEGLRDRAITRDLDWGIDVPKEGYEKKKIYIWAENVLGYLSASKTAANNRGTNFDEIWGTNAKHYYIHGKDNIPFHTIILPSLLLANGKGWRLPDTVISSEYLTLEGRKISTSQNWAIWVKDIVENYNPDSVRYFLLANGPEKKDTDFSWREFVNSHNGELLGAYGNLINRTLVFVDKYYNKIIPDGTIDNGIREKIKLLFASIGAKIEKGEFRAAIDEIFEFVRFANKYFDTERPWETRTTDINRCSNTIFNCVHMAANLAVLLKPFLPFSSEKVQGWLGCSDEWKEQNVPSGFVLPEIGILFERIDKKVIDIEMQKLSL